MITCDYDGCQARLFDVSIGDIATLRLHGETTGWQVVYGVTAVGNRANRQGKQDACPEHAGRLRPIQLRPHDYRIVRRRRVERLRLELADAESKLIQSVSLVSDSNGGPAVYEVDALPG